MMYEISPQMRTIAIRLENERRKKQSEKSCTLNSTSTEGQTLNPPERGTVYREEIDYREGFKWPHNKYEKARYY
jgi:hypothetical protein